MAQFNNLKADASYDIISAKSGRWITQGIQGADALAADWPAGSEAWYAGEEDFVGQPIETAS